MSTVTDMAAWVGRLIDAAGLKTATLIGHSMGAIISLETAAALPQRIDRIALLGITAAMQVHPGLLDAAKNNPDEAYQMMTDWSHGKAAKMGRNQVPGMWMTGSALALFARNRAGVLFCDLSACNNWNTGPETAAKITCPTRIIVGKQDMMTPAKGGREITGLIAGSQLTELDDCSHMMMAEAPDAVLDALIDELGAV